MVDQPLLISVSNLFNLLSVLEEDSTAFFAHYLDFFADILTGLRQEVNEDVDMERARAISKS